MYMESRTKIEYVRFILALLTTVLLFCCACGEPETAKGNGVQVYYISAAETHIEPYFYDKPTGSVEEQVKTVLTYLAEAPEKQYKAPLNMDFTLLGTELQEGRLLLNVSRSYQNLAPTQEVLVRAALVRTLTQLDGVSRVALTVDGATLLDGAGDTVGWMTADQFIQNDGSEINTYEQVRVKLYFAGADGEHLIAAYREKFYSTNTPLERFVVEELLLGPSGKIEGLYPTINPDTKILSVMTKDGICYVNFDAGLLSAINNVPTEITVYSIVNSLVELSHIQQVQVLVNGEVPSGFGQSVFEKNMDFVTVLE